MQFRDQNFEGHVQIFCSLFMNPFKYIGGAAFKLECNCTNLLCSSDVELPQLSLQVGVDLQVEQGLADALLDLVRLLIVHLDDLTPGYASHGDF